MSFFDMLLAKSLSGGGGGGGFEPVFTQTIGHVTGTTSEQTLAEKIEITAEALASYDVLSPLA